MVAFFVFVAMQKVSLSNRYIQNPINLGAEEVVFADGLGGITDLTVGPDGYL